MSKAYVTLVTSDSWVVGAEVMMSTLLSTGTTLDRVVLVTADVSEGMRTKLRKGGVIVREVEPISFDNTSSVAETSVSSEVHSAEGGAVSAASGPEARGKHFCHVAGWSLVGLTKLRIWELVEYAQVLYIDADCIVMENLDEVFERDVDFAAAPDVFPPDHFNAGVVLIKPNTAVLTDMLNKANEIVSYDGGDTGFLNAYYPNWFTSSPEHRLPFGYNAQRTLYWATYEKNPGYWESIKPMKIIHYCSNPKPWDDPARKGELEMLWWRKLMISSVPGMSTFM